MQLSDGSDACTLVAGFGIDLASTCVQMKISDTVHCLTEAAAGCTLSTLLKLQQAEVGRLGQNSLNFALFTTAWPSYEWLDEFAAGVFRHSSVIYQYAFQQSLDLWSVAIGPSSV